MSGTRAVRVSRKWQEAEDIFGFELEDAAGNPLPPFSAGSHIDVHIPGGPVRQYSLVSQNASGHGYEIAVLRDPASRGGSQSLCDEVAAGDVLQISEPRNHFPLHQAETSLLIAGGIGITPIFSMAQRLSVARKAFVLHYCTRTRSKTAFIDRLGASGYSDSVFLHFDDGPDDQRFDMAGVLAGRREDAHLYVCGPAGFLEAVRASAKLAGWDSETVHFEHFSPPPAEEEPAGAAFEVVVASSGAKVLVQPEESVADALLRIGVDIPLSCEQGVCGTCLTRVVEGVPEHRDYYLSEAQRRENDQFLPCCSRSKSPRLVIDL